MKSKKAAGPLEVNTEMITESGRAGIKVLVKLCQQVLNGKNFVGG